MKNIINILIPVTLLIIAFGSCSKEETGTVLKIHVADTIYDTPGVAGATVSLRFSNLTDTIDMVQITNNNGDAVFNNISHISTPGIRVQKGCYDSDFGYVQPIRPIEENRINHDTIVVWATGLLKITNASASPYNANINFNMPFQFQPHETKILRLQASVHDFDYMIPNQPSTEQYTYFTISCGDTTYMTIP